MESFAPYAHTIAAMAGRGFLTPVMSPLSEMKKTRPCLAPDSKPRADDTSAAYRWHRANVIAAESTGTVALVAGAAMVAAI